MSKAVPVTSLFCVTPILSLLLAAFVFETAGITSRSARAGEPSKAPAQAKDPNGKSTEPVVVAKIGDSVITRAELEERLVQEIRPREEEDLEDSGPVTAESVLRQMLAEKAMSLEGRRLGYLNDETIRSSINQFEQQQMVGMLVNNYLKENPPATDAAAVARKLKEDPKLTREQAVMLVQRPAAQQILEKFYSQLTAKFQLKKLKENFAETARIHDRLLNRPAQPRGQGESWIKNAQVRNELSEQEKNLVLATYEGGRFTLKDWFEVVCSIVPPRRPADLSTPAGVENLLERALRAPILVAEAKSRGYDKDKKLRSDVRQLEDRRLLYKVQEEKTRDATEPNAAQIRAYFEKNKERFAERAALKVDQIWCADLETARKLKGMLEEKADFTALKKAHSLQKESEPHNVSPVGEGPFWAELWKAEPNQTVGPIRGFYSDGVRWRIVKILEKKPAKVQPYSQSLETRVKWAMLGERGRNALNAYGQQLLGKYPYEIFRDSIAGMDPLEIAAKRTASGPRK